MVRPAVAGGVDRGTRSAAKVRGMPCPSVTAARHTASICGKLGVASRLEAIRVVQEFGWPSAPG